MKTIDILNAANRHYPDGFLDTYYDPETGDLISNPVGGDSLAEFIVVELSEAAEDVDSAILLLDVAKRDIDSAIRGLLEVKGGKLSK